MNCIHYYGYTEKGGRAYNEDAYCAAESQGIYLFVVADGLGGIEAGEVAANLAINSLRSIFFASPKTFDLIDAIQIVNEQILDQQDILNNLMKTTIAAVLIKNNTIYCAHVGDTRIYLFDNNSIVYQSIDHSASQTAVAKGIIKQSAIRNHEERNILTQALGTELQLKIDCHEYNVNNVSAILLCSDGFWQYVFENEMLDTLQTSKTNIEWLSQMRHLLQFRVNGKNDNNTAIVAMKKEISSPKDDYN